MQASGLTEFIAFIYAPHVSGSVLFPSSPYFLHFPSPSAVTVVPGSIRWIAVLGGLIHIWRPEITDVCDISHLLIWQEIFSFHSIMWEPEKVYMQMLRLSNPIQQPGLQTNWKCIAASLRKCTPFLGLCWSCLFFCPFIRSQRVGHDWATERLIWSDLISFSPSGALEWWQHCFQICMTVERRLPGVQLYGLSPFVLILTDLCVLKALKCPEIVFYSFLLSP